MGAAHIVSKQHNYPQPSSACSMSNCCMFVVPVEDIMFCLSDKYKDNIPNNQIYYGNISV